RRAASASVANIPVLALAALLAVGPVRDEVEALAGAGSLVAVVVAPGVLQVGVLGIRPAPLVHAARLAHERLQVLGIAPDLELVHLDLPGEAQELHLGLLGLRLARLLEHLRQHEGHDAREQDEHDHDLEDRESPLAARPAHCCHDWIPLIRIETHIGRSYTDSIAERMAMMMKPMMSAISTIITGCRSESALRIAT